MQTHRGFSLIEIIISLLILSLILLGFDALQIVALRAAQTSYYLSVAIQQINNLSERLHILKINDAEELRRWNQQNKEVLPNGIGIVKGSYPHFTISIFWGGLSVQECKKNIIGHSGCITME